MTHYDVLAVSPTATAAEVRKAYLVQARRFHPDLCENEKQRTVFEHRMREINQAWSVLGDAATRRSYDRQLATVGATSGASNPKAATPRPARPASGADRRTDAPRTRARDARFRKGERRTGDGPRGDRHVGRSAPQLLVASPILLLVTGLVLLFGALLLRVDGLAVIGFVTVALAVVLFFFVPLVAMTRSRRR